MRTGSRKSNGSYDENNIQIDGMLVFKPDDSESDSKLEVESQNINSTHYSKEGPRQLPLFKLTIPVKAKRNIKRRSLDVKRRRSVRNLMSNSVSQIWSYASSFSEKIVSCKDCISNLWEVKS